MLKAFSLLLVVSSATLLIFLSSNSSRRRRLASYNYNFKDPKSIQQKTLLSQTYRQPVLRTSFGQQEPNDFQNSELEVVDASTKDVLMDSNKPESKPDQSIFQIHSLKEQNAIFEQERIYQLRHQTPIVGEEIESPFVGQKESLSKDSEVVLQGYSAVNNVKEPVLSNDITLFQSTPSATFVPSYIQLCSELIKRKNNPEQPTSLYIVRESPAICTSNDSYTALLTIMASTMIAQGAGFWRLQYQPTCELSGINEITIQQLLPQDLFSSMGAGMEAVSGMCKSCLEGTGTLDCLGFPILGINDPPVNAVVMTNRILAFRHNIQWAVKETRQMERAADRPSSTTGGAVVYLDLESPQHQSMAMPLSWYAERIPASISSIFVVVHQQCGDCVKHGQFVADFLGDMNPRATVHFEILGSTALVYSRMMGAPYLLCPPTTACLLPALMRDVSYKTFVGDSPAVYSWFHGAVQKAIMTFHVQVEVTKAEQVLSRPVQNLADPYSFLVKQPSPRSKTCLALRGRLGKWNFDADYGKSAQYVTPLKRFQDFPGFVPTESIPFRPATMYKWVDNLCPVDQITKEGFCTVMKELALTRIYFVGDTVQLQMAMSLWKLLGHEDEPVAKPKDSPIKPWMRFQWERVVDCGRHQIDFQFTRNDLIDNNNDENDKFDKGGEILNCGVAECCMPWSKSYANYQKGGTLLLANSGSHIHDIDSFPAVLRAFLSMMEVNQKDSDVVMFRTTVPGHEKCEEPAVNPFENHMEFESELVADYRSWHLFSEFNNQCKYSTA